MAHMNILALGNGNWKFYMPDLSTTLNLHEKRLLNLEINDNTHLLKGVKSATDKLIAAQMKTYFHGRDETHSFWVFPPNVRVNSKWDTHLPAATYCSNHVAETPVKPCSLVHYRCLGHSTLDDFRAAEEEWRRQKIAYPVDGIQTVYGDWRIEDFGKRIQALEALSLRQGIEIRDIRQENADASARERTVERHAVIMEMRPELEKLGNAYRTDMGRLEEKFTSALNDAQVISDAKVLNLERRIQNLLNFLGGQSIARSARAGIELRPCEQKAIIILRIIILIILMTLALQVNYHFMSKDLVITDSDL